MSKFLWFEEAEDIIAVAEKRGLKIDDLELQKTAQRLFERQFLFEVKSLDRKKFETISMFPDYFGKLAHAFGRRLVIDRDGAFVGVVPIDEIKSERGPMRQRTSQSQSCLLIAMRIAYEEAIKAGHSGANMVAEVPMRDLVDVIEIGLGEKFEWSGLVMEDIRWAKRIGVISGDPVSLRDEDAAIIITPAILHILGDGWLQIAESYHGSFGQAAIERAAHEAEVANETDEGNLEAALASAEADAANEETLHE